MTAEQIVPNMRRDAEAIRAYRAALLSAGVDESSLTDEQVIERTARLMAAVIEFGRSLKPFMKQVAAAIQRVGVVIHEAEQRSPAFAMLMAAERQRMEAERGR